MIGLKRGVVKLVPHKKGWAQLFTTERKKVMHALKGRVVEVEHIGSTSIPNLHAKPIIDILVGIKNMKDARACINPLRKLGYAKVKDIGSERLRLFFVKGGLHESTHHLHIVKWDGKLWRAHTAFSRYLRTNHVWTKKYHVLKQNLAKKFQTDREQYSRGKGKFVQIVIVRATKKKKQKL